MIINVLGDSITEGVSASKEENTFVYLLGQMLHAETRNYGISGSRIAMQTKPSGEPSFDRYFASRVDQMKNDADFVLVFGGTNDYGHGDAPFGNIGDKTPNTFCGAVDDLINKLLHFYRKDQLIFLEPLYRFNENNVYGDGSKSVPSKTLEEYRYAIRTIAKNYGITVLDFKDKIGRAENNPLIADGLHPNDKGHHRLAELLADYFKALR